MVAISLYRGNLHRVPNVPRRWFMPNRSLSLKSFKSLLNRRSKALSLVADPNPSPSADIRPSGSGDVMVVESVIAKQGTGVPGDETMTKGDGVKDELSGELKPEVPMAVVGKEKVLEGEKNQALEIAIELVQPVDEVDVPIDREKRKREVEEKLQVLNEKKHNLVQVLKQILNAEEELKRRSSMQFRPPPSLQVDVGNDSSSVSRLATPRMCLEANPGGELEGGDSRPLFRMSSTSPSPDSLRKPALSPYNPLPYPSRTNLVSGSPSRFAPPGHQGVPANLPSVSVSGTSYAASSPSPATSGRTAVSKDPRLPSPWN